MINVQFKDSTETTVIATFESAQDETQYPNQLAIEETDARYVAFVAITSGAGAVDKRKRNDLLSSSDWTTGNDSPLISSAQTEWKTYRQALRDITAQSGYPDVIAWPVAPV